MKTRYFLAFTWVTAFAVAAALPWLAWREAQRQAYDAQADITLGYAKDVLHRADKTGAQVVAGITRLVQSGHPPCSSAARQIMQQIDLTSTYIQAIGHVQGDVLVCSSISPNPIALGPVAYRTSRGFDFYLRIPGEGASDSLMAFGRDGYAALVHRQLPVDLGLSTAGAALGVLHIESNGKSPAEIARGKIDRRWLERLGNRSEVTFTDRGQLVAIARSANYRITGVAAVPLAVVEQRAWSIARRLVPAGVVSGAALALAALALMRRHTSIAGALRIALREDEFYLDYQPIVDLASARWVGVEALIRWRRGARELIGPDLFIPVAEQAGFMHLVTERVLYLVERDVGNFLSSRPDFHIALNLSPADLKSDAILHHLDAFLERTGAAPANLIVEITERGFLDMERARQTIGALRQRGIDVAIDDFGTGYSSLSYLESLDVDYLKIDRSFIDAIGTGAPTSHVVTHIMSMSKAMGLRMIAEGVERPEQQAFLRQHGVQFAQGWLYGKPMAFSDIKRILADQVHR